MASPFRVFRRNQKVMLAALVLLAMFAFVFGDVILRIAGNAREQNPVVVSTDKFGDLKQSQIQVLLQRQSALLGVWQLIYAELFNQQNPQLAGRIPLEEFLNLAKAQFGDATEKDVVNGWLAANYAEQMGIRISDEAIYQFLRLNSQKMLTEPMLTGILKNRNMTAKSFFGLMREALARIQLRELYELSMASFPPAQRWDYYCRANRKATIQYVALPVGDFLGQVKNQPTKAELEAFFQKYKDHIPQPDSSEPGFTVPKKIDVQYFEADLTAYTTPQTVSDEEIQAQYETDPKRYDKLDQKYRVEAALKKAGEKKETEKKSAAPAEESQKPEEKKPEKTPAGNADSSPLPPGEGTSEDDAKKKNPPKTSATPAGPFHLVALGDDPPPAALPETAAPDVKAPAEAPEAEKEIPARPLRDLTPEVRKIIRREVEERKRREAATKKLDQAFKELRKIMAAKGREWDVYEMEKTKKPVPLNFAALAKKYGCSSGQTGLVSRWELDRLPIAQTQIQSKIQTEQPSIFEEQGSPLTPYVFDSLVSRRATLSATPDRQRWFLFWKTEEREEHTLKFTEPGTREKVLHEWRVLQARSLAEKEAERLAGEVRKNKTALQEAFAGRTDLKVQSPPAFSWYTEGNLPRERSRMTLSTVEGIPQAGNDFMQEVFTLEKGETGVAMNRPKTEVYVVQIVDFQPSKDALWVGFKAESFSLYAGTAADEMRRANAVWWEELQRNAGLQWKERPKRTVAQDAAEEE
ncbi:MAG: hypothetical protein JXB10_18705 [Pirellulales bacterium]|nr:hypothetical protein [Pirellulales bacterium]